VSLTQPKQQATQQNKPKMEDKKKKTKKRINVHDLKPSKDAKGGVSADFSVTGRNLNRGVTGHSMQRPGRGRFVRLESRSRGSIPRCGFVCYPFDNFSTDNAINQTAAVFPLHRRSGQN
jgi:hypothetical protein